MKSLVAAACLGAALVVPQRAPAQSTNNQISYAAVIKAPVGAWAEYLMTRDEHEKPVRVRYTLVERGSKTLAIELDSTAPAGHVLVRMEYAADGPTRYRLQRAVMKMPDGKLQVLPTPAAPDQSASFGKGDAFGDALGKESIRVAAGTFQAERWRRGGIEVWMDDKAVPVGLVKLATAGDGPTVELVAMGKGGKSGF